jgi:hypothetical protein
MNERIADLLAQTFDQCKKYDDEGETGLVKTTEAFIIFAELIVRECAGICFSEAEGHNMAFGEHCGIVIKEHFGIE